jgi:hypothetical protein
MNSKSRDTQDGSVDLDQFGFESTCLLSCYYSSGHRKVTIQPGMPYPPAVRFDTDLKITRSSTF